MAHPIPNSQQGAREIRVAATSPKTVLWLQGITLAWMLVECAVSLYAAKQARSVVLLAFGADSGIELLSAIVALVSFMPSLPITIKTSRWAGILLYFLAGVIVLLALLSFGYGVRPETSGLGIAIAVGALVVMPLLAWMKRRVALATGSNAMAADAVQSATCAYLALITLVGLGSNAIFKHSMDRFAGCAGGGSIDYPRRPDDHARGGLWMSLNFWQSGSPGQLRISFEA